MDKHVVSDVYIVTKNRYGGTSQTAQKWFKKRSCTLRKTY